MHTLSEKINQAFAEEKWDQARKMILGELKKSPRDHWFLTRLSAAYYEQKKYREALQFARRAQEINPNCPLVLWDLGGALFANGKIRQAMEIFQNLLERGHKNLAKGPCGEGERWAISFAIDCLFWLALCYRELGDYSKTLFFLTKFIRLKTHWPEGVYNLEDGIKELADMAEPMK